jgi:Ca2+-binding EF-hand superfamily protein
MFEKMDMNGDGLVEEAEMVEFLTRANPVRGINVADAHLLF